MERAILALPKSLFPQLRVRKQTFDSNWLDVGRTNRGKTRFVQNLLSGKRIGNVTKAVAKMKKTGLWQKTEDGNFGACADVDFAVGNGGHGELDGIAGLVAAGASL